MGIVELLEMPLDRLVVADEVSQVKQEHRLIRRGRSVDPTPALLHGGRKQNL